MRAEPQIILLQTHTYEICNKFLVSTKLPCFISTIAHLHDMTNSNVGFFLHAIV